MKKDDFITEVIFRKVKSGSDKGTIEAFFPYDIADHKGNITCYAHVGQHSGACWDYFLFRTIPANESEYNDLKSELESLGYNLKVVKKRNYRKYLAELNKSRQVS
jgi:hypothetical protein